MAEETRSEGSCKCKVREKVHDFLSSLFDKLAGILCKYPWFFVVVPFLLSGALGSGLYRLRSEADITYLYVPTNAQSLKDQRDIEKLYGGFGDENLLAYQRIQLGLYAQVLILPKDETINVMTVEVMEEVLRLHDHILQVEINHSETNASFNDLCLMWNNKCQSNAILDLIDYNASNIESRIITYPFAYKSSHALFIGNDVGGVTFLPDSNEISKANVTQLTYTLRDDSDDEETLGISWENAFLEHVNKFESDLVTVYRRTSHTIEQELQKATSAVVLLFAITFTLLITFSIVSCMMCDWVTTKFFLASLGVLSAGLAILSSMGLMAWCNVPFINEVGAMPFLILGIGVDDMFIMIAAWRKSDLHKSADKRLREAFSEAAMSITITSLTDFLAFCIGAITPFRSVQIFCLYTGVAVAFDYIFQITFFGAFMYFSGRREQQHRHAICFCRKVSPRNSTQSICYQVWCAGGSLDLEIETGTLAEEDSNPIVGKNTTCEDNENEYFVKHAMMTCFRKTYGVYLTTRGAFIVTTILYVILLGVGIVGIVFQLETGLVLSKLVPDNSYALPYFNYESMYFKTYGPMIFITVTEPVAYWESKQQQGIMVTLQELEESEYFHESPLTVCWLRDYLKYLDQLNIVNPSEEQFKTVLKYNFLPDPLYAHYGPDIAFDSNTSNILSTRSYVTFKDIESSTLEEEAMLESRRIVGESEIVQVAYHPTYTFFDQYIAVVPNTVRNLLIASLAMFFVSFVMMPDVVGVLFVMLSILSILVCVIGYMAFWKVALDTISMVNLILCIGFSVDFSAHVVYSYFACTNKATAYRVQYALYSHGWPIVQGACSTIIGVAILNFSDSYIFRSFFKTIFLVIALGALHGLVVMPSLLYAMGTVTHNIVGPSPNKHTDDTMLNSPFPRTISAQSDDSTRYAHKIINNIEHLNKSDTNMRLYPTKSWILSDEFF